jgi:hypothetical protein
MEYVETDIYNFPYPIMFYPGSSRSGLHGARVCKCYLFDKNGYLKDAFMGIDQSYTNGYFGSSSFYSSCTYKDGNPTYYKGLQGVFSKFPADKHKPKAHMINLGSQYWVILKDDEKNTIDIYEL